jgi:hypothetical protein
MYVFDAPSDEVLFVLIFMHAADVLFEVVKTRPDLLPILAMLSSALPRVFTDTNAMNTLSVAFEVIGSSETSGTSPTIWYLAFVGFVMPQHMLPSRLALVGNIDIKEGLRT